MVPLLLLSLNSKADNLIELDQALGGDNLDLNIVQVGANNTIQCYVDSSCWIGGDDFTIHLEQYNTTNSDNVIEIWHLEGDGNSVRFGQGLHLSNSSDTTFSYDGSEGGGHYARLDIHGDNNSVSGFQQNAGSTTGHIYRQLIFSDDNTVWIKQQNNGQKTIDLSTYSDENAVSIVQKGNNAQHQANVTLNGTYGTDLNLIQQGTTTQTYQLTQYCYTVGGCSVSVTQE
jgi:hypothetical protein